MELIYGTRNPAKAMSMRKMLSGLDLQLGDLCSLEHPPVVEETGSSPLDNAREKAETYYRFTGRPVFACDSGLFIEGLNSELQPGVKIRRLGDKVMNDDEMIDYYSRLVAGLGGRTVAHYRNAIFLVLSDDRKRWLMDDTIEETFYLVSKPHSIRVEGFPMNSLSVDVQSGKYFVDLTDEERASAYSCRNGFRNFFSEAIR